MNREYFVLTGRCVTGLSYSQLVSDRRLDALTETSGVCFLRSVIGRGISRFAAMRLVKLIGGCALSDRVGSRVFRVFGGGVGTSVTRVRGNRTLGKSRLVRDFRRLLILTRFFSRRSGGGFLRVCYSGRSVEERSVSNSLVLQVLEYSLSIDRCLTGC